MKKIITIAILLATMCLGATAQRKTDPLDRGLVAIAKSSGVFVSWRIQPEEYYDVTYNLYRNGTKIASNLSVSNYTDDSGTSSNTYTVSAVVDGVEQSQCTAVTPWNTGRVDKSSSVLFPCPAYKAIQVADVYDRNGTCVWQNNSGTVTYTANYTINDISLGDVDGDGQIDFIVKRKNQTDCDNLFPTDNTTAFCRIEVYASSADYGLLWYIDCGPNTVYGADEQWDAVAFDWDQDGRCEVLYRAYANTIIHKADGSTVTIGSTSENIRSYVSHVSNMTFTNCGNEYLVYMDGKTGAPYVTMEYPLKRLESSEFSTTIDWTNPNSTAVTNYLAAEKTVWGDNYGHRSSKYFMGAPYLDGRTPSIYLGRGIYTQEKMIAYDVDPSTHALTQKWTWSNSTSGSEWYGQGYHNFAIADVDGDGCDEIVYGSMVIDNNGKGLSTTGLGHGDASHTGDLDPFRKGMETFACNEDSPSNNYRNTTTSELYYRLSGSSDDGRSMAGNFSDDYPGSWGASASSGIVALSATTPGDISDLTNNWNQNSPNPIALNFRIYWDGDLCEETVNGPGSSEGVMFVDKLGTRIIQTSGAICNNGTKKNPCAQGDIIGDWREELVLRSSDNTEFRIYSTTDETEYRIPSLWYDAEYRQAMVWQTEGYNQPPHTSFFLGKMEGITAAPVPYTNTDRTELSAGSIITSSYNSKSVMLCEGGNYGIDNSGISPKALFINVPSTVSGSGSNSGISYSYATTILGATINSTSYKGALTGSMRLCKQGDGLLKMTKKTNTYTGNTDIWSGDLAFHGELTNSAVWMNRHTNLFTSATYDNSVTMEYGSALYVTDADNSSTTDYTSVTVGDLTMHEGSRLVLDVDPSGNQADNINITNLTIRTQTSSNWATYGPEYSQPVIQINSTSTLASGTYYKIGTITGNYTASDLDDITIEATTSGSSVKLVVVNNILYLTVDLDSSNIPDESAPTASLAMTYVDGSNTSTSYGNVTTACAGYNKISSGSVALAYSNWGCNWITYIKIDASAYKNYDVSSMTFSFQGSGSTDSKRTTTWGIGYNSSTWSSSMTYSSADRTITTFGSTQTGTSKSSSTYNTFSWDIADIFNADADGVITLIIYETSAAGGYVTSPALSVTYTEKAATTSYALTDGTAYTNTTTDTYDVLTYSRTFSTASQWEALYVPFSINVADYTSSFDIAEIYAFCPYNSSSTEVSDDDDDILIVSKLSSGTTSPNVPYLIRPKSATTYTITSADGKLYAAASGTVKTATTKTLYTVTGNYSSVSATTSNGYCYMSGGQIVAPTSTVTISPFRWYMTSTDRSNGYSSSSSAKAVSIMVLGEDIDGTTAINAIRSSKIDASDTYTMQGIKVDGSLKRGIYIKDGKKVVVK